MSKSKAKTEVVQLRVTVQQRRELEKSARKLRLTTSDYMRLRLRLHT